MAHGDYYNPANKSVTDGTVVYADDINKINTAIDSALEQVAYDLDVIEADLEAGGLSAKNWATEDQGTRPDPILDLYSAKAYALEAKDWASASGTITEASTGAALAGSASAKTKAAEAANSALAASGSASSAAGSAITATNKAGEALNSANAAALSETNAGNSAISAAASAANLPNATTAGANKLITTNSSGSGWEYPSITAAGKAILDDVSAAEQRATLGLGNVANVDTTNASNITSGTLAEARLPSTIARDSEVAALFSSRSRKNLLINGGFDVWQRGTSFTATGTYYTADRWEFVNGPGGGGAEKATSGVIITYTFNGAQTYRQKVENVTKFSDTSVTFSFDAWDELASGGVVLSIKATQNFGTGGTPAAPVVVSAAESITVISSRMRYQVTIALPSTSGKTLGTNNDSFLMIEVTPSRPASDKAVGLDRCQLEFGDTATDFEYRHPAEELALCQQYYEVGSYRGLMAIYSAGFATAQNIDFKVTKRVAPLDANITLGTVSFLGSDATPGAGWHVTAYPTTNGITPLHLCTGGTVGRAFIGTFTWAVDVEL